MLELEANLWDLHAAGATICITTNGAVRKDGACVMGRGCALEAARKYPRLPYQLGAQIQSFGNHAYYFPDYRILSFPVKHHWSEEADLELIKRSCHRLELWLEKNPDVEMVYLPRPGCGNGRLRWADIKREIADLLSNKVTIVTFPT